MRERAVNLGRLAFGLLAAVALGVQAYHVCTRHASLVNFFSYFTDLSNMAGAVVLLTGGTLGLLGRRGVPDPVRGAVVLCMTVTGVVYAVLLAGYHLPLELPWVNAVLHKLMPAVHLADWLITPPRRRIAWRRAVLWLAFPLLYLVYSLLRGAAVDWYPYPFLDPRRPHGYGRVAVASAMITVLFVAVGAAVVWTGNRLGRRSARSVGVHT
ncbi:Pr6Pr family membrane protein [Kitasatospora paracochleata]|uniref:FAR-17a/AIG1-like protein n=1 Tax=Kitasatospora paracochleata TaxID=58354 RepID=A0ABT1ITN1_9ACTN|nr:Pr6Pr family membrane protein [Kitasatospora paracochleata]MCP2308497.1 hypothetical protein [Kitasatospora paracochleata]